MNTTTLNHTETKGVIVFFSAAITPCRLHGFFRLSADGRSIEGRATNSRNIHRICSIENVIDFEETSK